MATLQATSALTVLAALAAAGACSGQNNDVERRNTEYLWFEAVSHPNGNAFPDRRQNPPAHAMPGGVPRGTRSYVWIPAHTNDRAGVELIDGFRAPLGPSSATSVYPALLYYPEIAVHRTTKSPGGHVEPDVLAPAHIVIPEAPLVFARFGFFESGSSLLTPAPLPDTQRDVVVSLRWNQDDSRWTPNTLNMWGDAYGDRYSQPVFGFVDPQGVVSPVLMTSQPGYLNLTYRRAEPTINVRSEWGRSYRNQGAFPGLWGYSISTYEAPVSQRGGQIAWDIQAGPAYAGAMAIPMLNVGSVYAGSRTVLGQTIDVDVMNPALPLLAPEHIVTLDPLGFGRGVEYSVQPLGTSALGMYAGVEYVLIDAGLTQVLGTTQAAWVLLDR